MFAKPQEKAARLEQTIEKRFGNMESSKETKVIPIISSGYPLPLSITKKNARNQFSKPNKIR